MARPFLFLFALIGPCVFNSVGLAEDATLEEIRTGYIQAVTSWRGIWTRCQEFKTLAEKLQDHPRFANSAKRGAEGAFVDWAVKGEMFHVSRRSAEGIGVLWFSYDGKTTWTLEYSDDGEIERVLKQRLETKTDAKLTVNVNPGRFLGLYFNVGPILGRGVPLKSLLMTEPLTLIGREDVEGASCWKVEFLYPATDPDIRLPMSVWFDPAHDYLPHRIVRESSSGTRTESHVVSFQQVSVGDDVVSFPSEMVEEHPLATRRLSLLEIKLNDQLPGNLFRPTFPRSARVWDLDDEQAAKRLRAELEKPAREQLRAKIAAKAAARKQVTPPPPIAEERDGRIDAAPPPSRLGVLVLITTGLVVLLMVTLHTWRKS